MNIQLVGLDLIRNPDKLYGWMGLKQSPGTASTTATQATKAPFVQKPKKEKDPFLEGFYSVADKPKEERRSYTSPLAKSRAILDSMTNTKPAKKVEEEDDFLKGFYSVADRPDDETPISAQPPTVQKNTQTTYKPGDWIKRTLTQSTPWNAKNTDLSPQKVNYASNINARTGESRDEYDSRIRQQYAARRQAEEDARYADYDVEAAQSRLDDYSAWTDKLIESRKAGNGFDGDYDVVAERNALEAEIKRAKAAQERNRARKYAEKERYMSERLQSIYDDMQARYKSGDWLRSTYNSSKSTQSNDNIVRFHAKYEPPKYYLNPETTDEIIYGLPNFWTKEDDLYGSHTDQSTPQSDRNESTVTVNDVLESMPFERAKYPYAERIADKILAGEHTRKELEYLSETVKNSGDIPSFDGIGSALKGATKSSIKPQNISGKAVSKLLGEATAVTGVVLDITEVASAVSRDLADDGNIGKDSYKTGARVIGANLGGAAGAWAAGSAVPWLLGLVGVTLSPLAVAIIVGGASVALSLGASYLGGVAAEEAVDAIMN